MKIKAILFASAAIFAGISVANAADAIVYEEPAPVVSAPVFSWTGGYLGGQVGWGWAKSTFDLNGYNIGHMKPDGFLGGLYAGYNFDLGNNVVLGLDGDVTFNNQKDNISETFTDGVDSLTLGAESKLRTSGAVRARVGYAFDRWLPYVAAGVAIGSVKNTVSASGNIDGQAFDVSESKSKTHVGWTAGAGVDYAATDNVILRLEYRYSDYGKKNYSVVDDVLTARNKFKTNEVRLGVAYKF
ncbi:porin family protein [Brucella pseudogrignonensis]|uniref:outer membrane protein n=1 Tax=Brucella pseudogrignonensis TaxID=419475 RepID=UPI0028B8696F|nr:porin family protein [Brucella pseudogrignonensis]MDT6940718.1 porin family protein [Brucella pseudogrignonensis]